MDQSVENGAYEADTSAIGHVDLAHVDDFVLGPLSVAPSRRLISGTLSDATLEPKVMVVLVALARAGTRTLSKDDLIRQCWDGRIVGDASINRVISLLRTALRETTGEAVQVETIPKVGYRVLLDDHAVTPSVDSGEGKVTDNSRKFGSLGLVGGMAFALVAAIVAYFMWPDSGQDRISIAMLPFEAREGTDGFYASGLASELQSELARYPNLEITSPDSAKQMLAMESTAQEIGGLLKADNVLKGSIEAAAERTMLRVELISSASGQVVWSETLASSPESAETLPARAARELAQAIGLDGSQAREQASVAEADFQLFATARGMIASRQPEQLRRAAELLAGIVERNPDFAGGWSARAKAVALLNGSVGDPSMDEQARSFAAKALEIDPDSVEALKISGLIAIGADKRVEYLRSATELDPGDAEGWLWYGHVTDDPRYPGELERAMLRLVELDPLWDRSWQAAYYVRGAGNGEGADRIDGIIAAAAAEPWQAEVARARIALRKGDQSEFIRVVQEAMPVLSIRERQLIGLQLLNQTQFLGLPSPMPQRSGMDAVVDGALIGDLPSQAEMERLGIDGERFFAILPLVIGGSPALIADGREAELVGYFDEVFASPQELETYAHRNLRTHHFLPQIATYVGYAMQKVGRTEDADALFGIADKSVQLWEDGPPNMTGKIFAANLAAARGDKETAVSAIEQAIALGWPYNSQSPGVAVQGPLSRDVIWRDLQDDAELVRVLAPVKDNLAKERLEVLSARQ